jgi:CBS domain-containing protein
MPLEIVKDIMIPLEEYALVDEDATMVDALHALEKSQDRVPEGRHPHRAVLVKAKDGSIIGKLGHHAFLAGLEPHYSFMDNASGLSRSGHSKAYLQSIMEHVSLWKQDFNSYVRRAMTTKVGEVMHPVAEHVQVDDPIGEAIHKLIAHQSLSLVVLEADRPVGILRLSDLFSVVAKIIKRRSARMSSEAG